MSTATWTPATNASSSQWSKNKARSDLQDAAPLYNDSTITYSDSLIYYNGYNSTTTTPEGENPATWTKESESPATWTREAE